MANPIMIYPNSHTEPVQIIRIKLSVPGDPSVEPELGPCLKKQLEKFDDLEIVEEDPADWQLEVLGTKMPIRGRITGLCFFYGRS